MENLVSELINKNDKMENLVSQLKDKINLLQNEVSILKDQNQGKVSDNKNNNESNNKVPIKTDKYDNNSPIISASNLSEQKEETIKKADKKDSKNENDQ